MYNPIRHVVCGSGQNRYLYRIMQPKLHKPTMAIGYSLRMRARHVDSTNPGRSNLVQADSTSRLPISVSTLIQGYFNPDWSNRHFVRTCAVSSQWPLSVYEVLVAYRFDPTKCACATTCRIGLSRYHVQ